MKELIENAIKEVLKKIDKNIEYFGDMFPTPASTNLVYQKQDNTDDWVQSFYTGMIWLAYELTADDKYLNLAKKHTQSFMNRVDNNQGMGTHDIGFMYTLSAVADYKLTKDPKALETAVKAADKLMIRFREKGEFIQAWGDLDNPSNYRLIIDCYMNLPLLFFVSEETKDETYKNVAIKHAYTALNTVLREDNSTFHTFYFDPETGEPDRGVTAQGYTNNSCWARGQAWGIYGFALVFSAIKDELFLESFHKIADYFIKHLPKDNVPYWDLAFQEGDEERDSSSASIAICGFLEVLKHIDDKEQIDKYRQVIEKMLTSLINNYNTFDNEKANGLLLHGVYSKPGNMGVDEMVIWGDYFFFEALVRLSKDWKKYW